LGTRIRGQLRDLEQTKGGNIYIIGERESAKKKEYPFFPTGEREDDIKKTSY